MYIQPDNVVHIHPLSVLYNMYIHVRNEWQITTRVQKHRISKHTHTVVDPGDPSVVDEDVQRMVSLSENGSKLLDRLEGG